MPTVGRWRMERGGVVGGDGETRGEGGWMEGMGGREVGGGGRAQR